MKIEKLVESLDLKVLVKQSQLDSEYSGAYVSDLLSDVMGKAQAGELWITLQSHMNVVAIASLKDLPAVIFVNGISPSDEVIKKAEEEGVILLLSNESTFNVAGKVYQLLKEDAAI